MTNHYDKRLVGIGVSEKWNLLTTHKGVLLCCG